MAETSKMQVTSGEAARHRCRHRSKSARGEADNSAAVTQAHAADGADKLAAASHCGEQPTTKPAEAAACTGPEGETRRRSGGDTAFDGGGKHHTGALRAGEQPGEGGERRRIQYQADE
ncbi:hypothetical protein PMKS-002814 [Pichia membranifaciens]|uniref:Uncharacterized protein n=1 Tax=Pichia membranifaciens TaxID=4926 RepID=A0A1Q2YIF6_9ASCO|nr:hypothetical protein PMKS-002814 [Pichia membranifaciens]